VRYRRQGPSRRTGPSPGRVVGEPSR